MEVVCVGQLTKLIGNFATAPQKNRKKNYEEYSSLC